MRWLACFAPVALLSACNGTVSVTFVTGPQEFDVSTDALALPTELREDDGSIRSLPCGPEGMCPPSEEVTLTCENDFCDPAPRTLAAPVGDVIDVEALLADTSEIGVSRIESYSFDSVAYEVITNTLTFPVGPVDIYWGPESATAIDPARGVMLFGTLPTIQAGSAPRGQLQIDPEGAAALSDFLVDGGARIRFFAQTVADLDPGDPFPEGSIRASVNLTVTAVGRVFE